MHDAFAVGIVVFQNSSQGDGVLKSMEENIESDAGFQDIRMETEEGIDPVQFKVGAFRQAPVRECPARWTCSALSGGSSGGMVPASADTRGKASVSPAGPGV